MNMDSNAWIVLIVILFLVLLMYFLGFFKNQKPSTQTQEPPTQNPPQKEHTFETEIKDVLYNISIELQKNKILKPNNLENIDQKRVTEKELKDRIEHVVNSNSKLGLILSKVIDDTKRSKEKIERLERELKTLNRQLQTANSSADSYKKSYEDFFNKHSKLEIENKLLKEKIKDLIMPDVDQIKNTTKEIVIDTNIDFRSHFKDYLLNFRNYVFMHYRVNIDFYVDLVSNGLKLTLGYRDKDELAQIQQWLAEFVKRSKSVEDIFEKQNEKQRLLLPSKEVFQAEAVKLFDQFIQKTGGSFEVSFKFNWNNEGKANEYASNIIKGDPAIAEGDRLFLKALHEVCPTAEQRIEVLNAVKEVREAEKNKTPLPPERQIKLAELVGEFVKGVANTVGTKSFEQIIKYIPEGTSEFITKNLSNLFS